MNSFLKHVRAAVQAVDIHGPADFAWLGQPGPRPMPTARHALTPAVARAHLSFMLRQQLYQNFYTRGWAMPTVRAAAQTAPSLASPFVDALSAANAGQGSWQGGWTIRALHPNGIVASHGGLTVAAQPDEYRLDDGAPLVAGADVCLRFPKEARRISPGFYMAEGDLVPGVQDGIVRLYWHLRPEGAADLMREITTRLNAARLPFRFKVLNNPDAYDRCDAGVLYLRKQDYLTAVGILEHIYPLVAANLGHQTPAFTKALAPGLGLAEDPGDGESFGQHRCGLLAEGLVRAHEQRQQTTDGRLATVVETFAEAGVDLERPYLQPGSVDIFEFRSKATRFQSKPERNGGKDSIPAPHGVLLAAALDIGRRLAREAIWHEDHCTWMTADLVPQTSTAQLVVAMRLLGPDLYSGASGVALFLAELAAQTGDRIIRQTALGAIRQALAHVDEVRPEARVGLYSGWLGVAYAAVRTGSLLREPDVVVRGANLLQCSVCESRDERMTDLLAGLAGAIIGALALRPALGDDAILAWARSAGDDLLRTATRSGGDGYSWHSPVDGPHPDLTGFSHGAAGIGHALLELYAATGEDRFRHGALQAFAYERQWFEAATGNWADLRNVSRRTKPGSAHLPTMVAWCHGAPGIALSRLRAWELLGDERARTEAAVALATTRMAVALAMERGDGNCSLCHGLLGNAEVLLHGAHMLGDQDMEIQAREAALASIAAYGAGKRPWPCGAHTGEVPGLMLGLAGIGHVFLRLHDPAVPSVLFLRPTEMPVSTDRPQGHQRVSRQAKEDLLVVA